MILEISIITTKLPSNQWIRILARMKERVTSSLLARDYAMTSQELNWDVRLVMQLEKVY